jgi:hypothetical protein
MPEVQRTDQRVVLYLVLHTYYVVPLKLLEEPLARSTVAGEGSFEIGNDGTPRKAGAACSVLGEAGHIG